MSLFTEEEGKVKVSTELKLIPEFRRLIERDKDRFKKQALIDFTFIYFMWDYKSPYMLTTSEKDREAKICKEILQDNGYAPRGDADLIAAVAKYQQLQHTITMKSVNSTREGLFTSTRLIDILRNRLDEVIERETITPGTLQPQDIEAAVKNLEQLLALGTKLPTTIDVLEKLQDKVKKEQSGKETSKVRGGGEKGDYEE